MSRLMLRSLAVAAILAGTASCGSDEGPTYSSTIDAEGANAAANEAALFAQDLSDALVNWGYSSELPIGVRGTTTPTAPERLVALVRRHALMRGGAVALANAPSPYRVSSVCTPTETGVDAEGIPVDTDGDGIPNDYKIDFGSSCVETDGDYTTTFAGSIRIRDVGTFYGYRLDIANMKIRFAHLAEYEEIRVSGYEQGTFAAELITHALDADYGMSYSFTPTVSGMQPAAPVTGSSSFGVVTTASYDPVGTITLGGSIPSGTFTFAVDYKVAFAGEEGDGRFHFEVASTPTLGIEASPCAGPTSGAIDGRLNGDPDIGFTATWTACNTFTVVTRGTTEPPAVRGR